MAFGTVESVWFGVLAIAILIGGLGMVIGLEMRAKRCMTYGIDYGAIKRRILECLGEESEPYYVLAGWRRLAFRSRLEDTSYHQCICMAVMQDKIAVFTLWKTNGSLQIKQIHVERKDYLQYVLRKNKMELFFHVPGMKGELIVCVEPKFFSQEDWHAHNAIGISQQLAFDRLTEELKASKALRAQTSEWVNGKLSGTNLFISGCGILFFAIGAFLFRMFWPFAAEERKAPVPLTTFMMDAGDYSNGTRVIVDTGSVLTLIYEKPETYNYFAKSGPKKNPRKLYYLMTVGSGEDTRYVLLSSGEELLLQNGSKIAKQETGSIQPIFDSNAKKNYREWIDKAQRGLDGMSEKTVQGWDHQVTISQLTVQDETTSFVVACVVWMVAGAAWFILGFDRKLS